MYHQMISYLNIFELTPMVFRESAIEESCISWKLLYPLFHMNLVLPSHPQLLADNTWKEQVSILCGVIRNLIQVTEGLERPYEDLQ